jgi:hypothetical protein
VTVHIDKKRYEIEARVWKVEPGMHFSSEHRPLGRRT